MTLEKGPGDGAFFTIILVCRKVPAASWVQALVHWDAPAPGGSPLATARSFRPTVLSERLIHPSPAPPHWAKPHCAHQVERPPFQYLTPSVCSAQPSARQQSGMAEFPRSLAAFVAATAMLEPVLSTWQVSAAQPFVPTMHYLLATSLQTSTFLQSARLVGCAYHRPLLDEVCRNNAGAHQSVPSPVVHAFHAGMDGSRKKHPLALGAFTG